MNYRERIIREWEIYDKFLNKLSKNSKNYIYAYLIRNLYVAYTELPQKTGITKQIFKTIISLFNNVILFFLARPELSKRNETVLIKIKENMDSRLAKKLKIQSVHIYYKKKLNIRNISFIYYIIRILYLLFKEEELNKLNLFRCMPSLIKGIQVYENIELTGIKKIVTQRDRYPQELAILKRAKELKLITIKIEYFPALSKLNRNTIYCDYYFYPNKISKDIFISFPTNKDVIFVKGSFPYWDYFEKFQYQPVKDPKIISFFTQYGFTQGIFGGKGPDYYIKEILSVMPEEYILYIKVHPIENIEKYLKHQCSRVKIIEHGTIDNCILYSLSSIVMSISSFSTFESKHICLNTYFINYERKDAITFNYNLIDKYIDIISNKNQLANVLSGSYKVKSKVDFINYFNPTFPNTIKKLKYFLSTLR